ncbi:hypothetical protein [Paenibacillus harenae]|uniref:hypothetical protein n=1 Tax=Paenibacillus harenae TaxID=306543 RepID=UPI00279107AD|nr:hypothetical protein [Paenibacillus harenae]MDQ0058774.1 hypothetical protein [Paenibacillus harenae]
MRNALPRIERILKYLEQHQAEGHARTAIKEWLLASRAVIDSCIDSLEEKSNTPHARKINIKEE